MSNSIVPEVDFNEIKEEITVNDQIVLKIRNEQDAARTYEIIKDNDEEFSRWFSWVASFLEKGISSENILRQRNEFFNHEGATYGIYVDHILVGMCKYHNYSIKDRRLEIAYWIDTNFQGKGITTLCVKSLIDQARRAHFHRVELICAEGNKPSSRIAEKLGFNHEGLMKDVLLLNGKFVNMDLFALIL